MLKFYVCFICALNSGPRIADNNSLKTHAPQIWGVKIRPPNLGGESSKITCFIVLSEGHSLKLGGEIFTPQIWGGMGFQLLWTRGFFWYFSKLLQDPPTHRVPKPPPPRIKNEILQNPKIFENPQLLLGIPWPALKGALRNQFWKKRRPQPYWGGENPGNALEASNALNYRAWGIPAVLSR